MRKLFTTLLCGVALLLLAPGLAFGQQTGTIEGTVTDGNTGETLPGANVLIPTLDLGGATTADGTYEISGIDAGEYTIRATFVGYQSTEQTVQVEAGETTQVDLALQPDPQTLDEIVVTGLASSSRRQEAAVSVSQIDAGELTKNSDYQSVEQLLQGSVTGVNIQQSSGNVGSGIRFRVRGGVSLNGDGQPVIYVDGVRIDQNEVEGFGAGGQGTSPLADLAPENIQSVEVLKGPAATSIYGTDGAEGVVLIETKNGLAGQDLQVNYQTTQGWTERVNDYDTDTYVSTPNQSDIWRDGNINQHRVSATGSFSDVNYFTSYSYRDTEGILPNNNGTRNALTANFEINPNDAVRIRANNQLSINELQRPDNDNNIFGQLGNTLLTATPFAFTDSTSVFLIDDQFRTQRYVGSINSSYTPSAVSGLQITATAGADIGSRRQDRTFPFEGSYTGVTDGERNFFIREERQFNGDVSARYSYSITDDLNATSTVGTQVFTESRRTAFGTAQEFSTGLITGIGSGSDLRDIGEALVNERSAGIFGQQEFSYDDTYRLLLSLRRDYATQLGTEVSGSSILYPSARFSARLEQFDFVPDAFNNLKFRMAFGQSGSLPDSEDSQLLRYQAESSGFGAGATINSVGDPTLEPERVSEFTTGVDVDYQRRVSFSGTYFYQWTKDSIIQFEPAPSTGFGGFNRPRNVGEVVGQGAEFALDFTPLITEQHQIDLSFNYTYQWSRAEDLGGQTIPGGFDRNFTVEGLAPASFYGLEVDGAQFNDAGEFVGPNIVDQNGDGAINDQDRTSLGNPRPDHFGGVRLNVILFNNLTVTGLAEFQAGQQVLNSTERFAAQFGNHKELNELNERFAELEPGTDEYRNVANQLAELNTQGRLFDNFLYDASFLKVREIAVRYDFADLINQAVPTPVREFAVGLSGRNLFTFTDYPGPDPEVNFDGSRGRIQGQDFLTLQTPRSFTASLTVGI